MSWTECYECATVIESDEIFWSVNVHKESQRDWVITVHEATAVAVFCADCAAKRDLHSIYVPLTGSQSGAEEGPNVLQDSRSAARILSPKSFRQEQRRVEDPQ